MSLRIILLAAALPVAALAAELPAGTALPVGAQGSSSVDGTVRSFTLAPDGVVNGVLLDDGTEVHVSTRLAASLEAAVQPGDSVHVQGWRTRTPGVLAAASLTDARTGTAVAEPGAPLAPLLAPRRKDTQGRPPPGAREATLSGRVLRPLHNPDGETDGALLGDGTELRLPAGAAAGIANLLQPGVKVAAQGYALQTRYGQVMAVQAIGGTPETLTPVTRGAAAPLPPAGTPAPGVVPQP
ncbi:MAG: hypothetical protein M0Z28_12790 [Rhodospirillales bacterium]|nr:hypothetical protein [Rhodospirillales bacterium]